MSLDRDAATSVTLLFRLRDADDQEAWNVFVDRYAPTIFHWCRQFPMQESDAADMTQEVLLRLLRAMRAFQYDPARGTFRAWLKTVTGNVVRDLVQRWHAPDRGAGDTQNLQRLAALQDPRSVDALTAEIEAQHQRELLEAAQQQVRPRVQSHTWEAYRLTAIEQVTAVDAAARLALPVAEIYVAKSRVIKMLREAIRKLEGQP